MIKAPLETKETYLAGERLSFGLVLVGKIKDYLPYFIVTFKELSQAGLGRGRMPVELAAVDHVGGNGVSAPVYTREDNLVRPPVEAISWADLSVWRGSNNGSRDSRPYAAEGPTLRSAPTVRKTIRRTSLGSRCGF